MDTLMAKFECSVNGKTNKTLQNPSKTRRDLLRRGLVLDQQQILIELDELYQMHTLLLKLSVLLLGKST